MANYALRRYWAKMKEARASLSQNVAPSRFCVDCRWGRGEGLVNFFCCRSNFTCLTARQAAGPCGPDGNLFDPLA
jgi:hypothetical protein